MAIQLHNTCLVAAEWHLAEQISQHSTQSKELFSCSAMSGTLQPDQRELIKVEFFLPLGLAWTCSSSIIPCSSIDGQIHQITKGRRDCENASSLS